MGLPGSFLKYSMLKTLSDSFKSVIPYLSKLLYKPSGLLKSGMPAATYQQIYIPTDIPAPVNTIILAFGSVILFMITRVIITITFIFFFVS